MFKFLAASTIVAMASANTATKTCTCWAKSTAGHYDLTGAMHLDGTVAACKAKCLSDEWPTCQGITTRNTDKTCPVTENGYCSNAENAYKIKGLTLGGCQQLCEEDPDCVDGYFCGHANCGGSGIANVCNLFGSALIRGYSGPGSADASSADYALPASILVATGAVFSALL
eukprot:gene12887-7142_t